MHYYKAPQVKFILDGAKNHIFNAQIAWNYIFFISILEYKTQLKITFKRKSFTNLSIHNRGYNEGPSTAIINQ